MRLSVQNLVPDLPILNSLQKVQEMPEGGIGSGMREQREELCLRGRFEIAGHFRVV